MTNAELLNRIDHLTKCLKFALLVIRNEACSAELSNKNDKSKRLFRFIEELKSESCIKDLTI